MSSLTGHPLLFLAALALAGCSSQADTAYRGEALATLTGNVQTSSTDPLPTPAPALEAALLWDGVPPGSVGKTVTGPSRKEVGTSIPVSGTFPAQFELDIYVPPPAEALFPCFSDGQPGQYASGEVAAVLQGQASTVDSITDLYGIITDYVVGYADQDIPAGSICNGGAAIAKGYHLYQYQVLPPISGCVPQGPDDTSCNVPFPYIEVPMSTQQTLVLSHVDGDATPPPTPVATP